MKEKVRNVLVSLLIGAALIALGAFFWFGMEGFTFYISLIPISNEVIGIAAAVIGVLVILVGILDKGEKKEEKKDEENK